MILFVNKNSGFLFITTGIITKVFREVVNAVSTVTITLSKVSTLWK